MLCLTKIKRSYIIEHVMPSDLDDKDIKHGLYLKEKMIQEMTDDYVKKNFPNWKQIERQYRKNGLVDICDKLTCGEMDPNDIVKPKSVRTEIWMRMKPFEIGTIEPHPKDPDEFLRYEAYDFDRLDRYSEWSRSDENNIFHLENINDIMIQFQLAIIGENAIRYYPFQDLSHYNGFSFVQDELKIYDPQNWDRADNSLLIGASDFESESIIERTQRAIDHEEEYYRFFFKNYKGYYNYQFKDDYDEWIREQYPNEKEVRTLQTDPFRIKYVEDPKKEYPQGMYCSITGKQWIKTNYKTEILNLTTFKVNINNTR